MRNKTSYLATQLHKLQQTNMLDYMMDFITENKQYAPKYDRYKNMKIYSDIKFISEIITESEVFICAYESNDPNVDLAQLFCVVQADSDFYQKVYIDCKDNDVLYNNGKWYTHVNLQKLDVSDKSCTIVSEDFKSLTNVIAIPLLRSIDTDIPLYAFVTKIWLCRSCNGIMCLPNIDPEIILDMS